MYLFFCNLCYVLETVLHYVNWILPLKFDKHNSLIFLPFSPFFPLDFIIIPSGLHLLLIPPLLLSPPPVITVLSSSSSIRLLSLPTCPPVPPLSQVRSRLTAGGPTVRRSLPGATSWCDTTTCTRGTSPSSSWPSEASVSPYHYFKCKHLDYICLYFLSPVNPDLVTPFAPTKPASVRASGVIMGPLKMIIIGVYHLYFMSKTPLSSLWG